jgi:hypothetical protein
MMAQRRWLAAAALLLGLIGCSAAPQRNVTSPSAASRSSGNNQKNASGTLSGPTISVAPTVTVRHNDCADAQSAIAQIRSANQSDSQLDSAARQSLDGVLSQLAAIKTLGDNLSPLASRMASDLQQLADLAAHSPSPAGIASAQTLLADYTTVSQQLSESVASSCPS